MPLREILRALGSIPLARSIARDLSPPYAVAGSLVLPRNVRCRHLLGDEGHDERDDIDHRKVDPKGCEEVLMLTTNLHHREPTALHAGAGRRDQGHRIRARG